MKKTLAILLVLAMIVAMVPAFTLSAAEGDTCTITEVKNETVTILSNKSSGWSYTLKNNGTQDPNGSGVTNWNTSIPADWAVTTDGQLFDNGYKDALDGGQSNVWDSTNRDLWIVRKVTITAEQYNQYANWNIASTLKHTDQGWFYINGEQVAHNPGGNTWQDELKTYILEKKVSDYFTQDGDHYSAYFAAYAQVNNAGGARHLDMSVEFKNVSGEEYIQVTIANADQYIDYVTKVNADGSTLNGNVHVKVTVTGNLDFTGKDYEPIKSLNNTELDFGNHTVSGINNVKENAGNQWAMIAVEATGNSVIKNVTLKDCSVTVSGGATWLGSVIGWTSNASVSNVTLDNVTLTNNCENTSGTNYTGIGAVVGVSNNSLTVDNVTIKNSTFNAPTNNVSMVIARNGAWDGGVNTFSNIKVESAVVNALHFGVSVNQQLSFVNPDNFNVGEGIDLSGIKIPGAVYTLTASQGSYAAYFQTRAGATTGTKDFRIIIVASEEYVNTMNELCGSIDFEATFRNGTDSKAFNLKAQTVYSKVEATDAAGNKETYTAAEGCHVFGWVVKGVPMAYASESGNTKPVLNIQINSTKYTEIELTYTKNSYYNSDNGNAGLSGGNATFYATQLLKKADLPAGTIITVDAGWQYRAERWNDEDVRPAGMNRPDNTATNVVVIDENWWGECTQLGVNVSKNPQSAITDDEMPTTRLHIYVPVSE